MLAIQSKISNFSFAKPTLWNCLLLFGLFVTFPQARAQDTTIEQGILKKSGCFVCHTVDAARVGPPYKDVAQRYAKPDIKTKAYMGSDSAADYLFKKVRMGTKPGVNKHWEKSKEGRPYGMMTPNPVSRISDDDLKKAIEYILGLK